MYVVTAWMGNTPKIALIHYPMVTDADFQKAMQNPIHSSEFLGKFKCSREK